MKLNCVTIDDEPLALDLINAFIYRTPFLNLRASYNKSSEAIAGLKQPGTHLIFLDIHMPGINGIEIARILRNTNEYGQPRVIFSTAHNQFAAESYQVEALDYLLKPFAYEDFLRAAKKGQQFFEKEAAQQKMVEDAIYVKTGYQQTKVFIKDIKYIQGLRDYAVIHLKGTATPIVTLSTLKALTAKLPADRFIRVQRSFIIAVDSVTTFSGNSLSIGGLEIRVGAQYRTNVRLLFENLL